MAYLPDALADDPTVSLGVRVLIEIQRDGGVLDWTPPLEARRLARRLQCGRVSIGRALAWGLARGYIERQRVSLPTGGRASRYRVCLDAPAPGGRSIERDGLQTESETR